MYNVIARARNPWSCTYMPDQQFCYTSQEPLLKMYCSQQQYILLFRVMSQSSYKNYSNSYTLVFLKRSHHCLFCSSRVHQEVKKAEVISKCRQNFRTKRFQRNPHNTHVEISTINLTGAYPGGCSGCWSTPIKETSVISNWLTINALEPLAREATHTATNLQLASNK